MVMSNRDFVQSQAQPVEKSGDSELSLLFSTKFGCMKQTDSNYLIITKHHVEISVGKQVELFTIKQSSSNCRLL